MSEANEAYIKQVESSFGKYILLIENVSWISSTNTEDIKTAFKLASFVEKSAKYLDENDMLDPFLNNIFKETTHNPNRYKKEMYLNAGDKLLTSFLQYQDITEIKMDIAIRMFVGSFSSHRLDKILENYILQCSSYEAVLDFVLVNRECSGVAELKCKVFLNKLVQHYRPNDNKVKEYIMSGLSTYKVDMYLDVFVGVLGLNVTDDQEVVVKNLILDAILCKMYDRSVMSKPFWLCLFKKVDRSNIVNACHINKMFLELLFRFLIYTGSMMETKTIGNKKVWSSNTAISICPEISYDDIVSILKLLCSTDSDIHSYVKFKITEASEQTDCLIFQELLLHLNSENT